MYTYDDYLKTAGFIDDFSKGFCPEILIILGSGLNSLADCMEKRASIPYEMIPGFKSSSAPGHMGRLVLGELKGKNVMAMQGRFHAYEGFSFEEIAYPVRTAKVLGADKMIVTNACGAINKSFNVGDIVALRDHINLTGKSPNTGKNLDEFGPRFFDMGECYSREYISAAEEEAEKLGIKLRRGVYFYSAGPQYETPAEIRAMGILGADVCGMSTVPEVTAARHCGIKTLGLSLVTNMAAGIEDKKLDGDEVIAEAEKAKDSFTALIKALIPRLR